MVGRWIDGTRTWNLGFVHTFPSLADQVAFHFQCLHLFALARVDSEARQRRERMIASLARIDATNAGAIIVSRSCWGMRG